MHSRLEEALLIISIYDTWGRKTSLHGQKWRQTQWMSSPSSSANTFRSVTLAVASNICHQSSAKSYKLCSQRVLGGVCGLHLSVVGRWYRWYAPSARGLDRRNCNVKLSSYDSIVVSWSYGIRHRRWRLLTVLWYRLRKALHRPSIGRMLRGREWRYGNRGDDRGS